MRMEHHQAFGGGAVGVKNQISWPCPDRRPEPCLHQYIVPELPMRIQCVGPATNAPVGPIHVMVRVQMAVIGAQAPSDEQLRRAHLRPVRDSASQHRERPGSRAARAPTRWRVFCRLKTATRCLPVVYSDYSRRRTNRGRETMRDDPWTAANRDKEQQKVTIPPRRKPTVETPAAPTKPTISGPFWTGKKSAPDLPKPQGVADARQRTDD